ncbi:hypothetical protein [Saccharothrix saharensis]|uniref:hypothetical protein n=1 Tax=Saccharothrix saharensis TaxID=571190 RepID=UPI001151EE93|nr:hypothetical protein [Saccharothrix saharensis]
MTALTQRVREFARILTHRRGQDLDSWIEAVLGDDLPALHRFVHGMRKDNDAVTAGLTPAPQQRPYRRSRQQDSAAQAADLRAGFALLRKRIPAQPVAAAQFDGPSARTVDHAISDRTARLPGLKGRLLIMFAWHLQGHVSTVDQSGGPSG